MRELPIEVRIKSPSFWSANGVQFECTIMMNLSEQEKTKKYLKIDSPHNAEVGGSSPFIATNKIKGF